MIALLQCASYPHCGELPEQMTIGRNFYGEQNSLHNEPPSTHLLRNSTVAFLFREIPFLFIDIYHAQRKDHYNLYDESHEIFLANGNDPEAIILYRLRWYDYDISDKSSPSNILHENYRCHPSKHWE